MKQSLLGRTFARWIVKGLLVPLLLAALVAGLAYTTHNGHGPVVAPGGCGSCNHYTMATSGSGTRAAPW
jgi:hypothetical protein